MRVRPCEYAFLALLVALPVEASASNTNSDNTGPCQVCHTRTGGGARWTNTGNAANGSRGKNLRTDFATAPQNAAFSVNCSKCHTSTFAKSHQTGSVYPQKFGLHNSTLSR
jgi:hypothetical protein